MLLITRATRKLGNDETDRDSRPGRLLAGTAYAQERRATTGDTGLRPVAREDVRAVAPSLDHYTQSTCSAWSGKGQPCRPGTEAS